MASKKIRKRNRKLTPRQKRFVQEYLVDLNATQAAIRAGYSQKGAETRGSELLRNRKVAAAVRVAKEKREERTEVTADKIVRELAQIAFNDMANYLTIDEDGVPRLDFSRMPEGATKDIQELTQDIHVEGRGDEAEPVKRTRFKLYSRLDALKKLLDHVAPPRASMELTGKDGGPLTFAEWFKHESEKQQNGEGGGNGASVATAGNGNP